MARIEQRLATMGLSLPPPIEPPPGVVLPFQFVRIVRGRGLVSGHGPQNADGSIAGRLGKVGRDLPHLSIGHTLPTHATRPRATLLLPPPARLPAPAAGGRERGRDLS
jgi:hypothetical protein